MRYMSILDISLLPLHPNIETGVPVALEVISVVVISLYFRLVEVIKHVPKSTNVEGKPPGKVIIWMLSGTPIR